MLQKFAALWSHTVCLSSLKMVNMNKGIHRCQEHQLHMWRKVYNCTQKMHACQQILRACEKLIVALIKEEKNSQYDSKLTSEHKHVKWAHGSQNTFSHHDSPRLVSLLRIQMHRGYMWKHPVLWKWIHNIQGVWQWQNCIILEMSRRKGPSSVSRMLGYAAVFHSPLIGITCFKGAIATK